MKTFYIRQGLREWVVSEDNQTKAVAKWKLRAGYLVNGVETRVTGNPDYVGLKPDNDYNTTTLLPPSRILSLK